MFAQPTAVWKHSLVWFDDLEVDAVYLVAELYRPPALVLLVLQLRRCRRIDRQRDGRCWRASWNKHVDMDLEPASLFPLAMYTMQSSCKAPRQTRDLISWQYSSSAVVSCLSFWISHQPYPADVMNERGVLVIIDIGCNCSEGCGFDSHSHWQFSSRFYSRPKLSPYCATWNKGLCRLLVPNWPVIETSVTTGNNVITVSQTVETWASYLICPRTHTQRIHNR